MPVVGPDADPRLDGLVVVFNASDEPTQQRVPGTAGQRFRLQLAAATDPAFGQPTQDAVLDAPTATVIAERLSDADAWATIAVVAGFDDLTWLRAAPDCSGMLIAPDGRIRRWAHGVEVAVADELALLS